MYHMIYIFARAETGYETFSESILLILLKNQSLQGFDFYAERN